MRRLFRLRLLRKRGVFLSIVFVFLFMFFIVLRVTLQTPTFYVPSHQPSSLPIATTASTSDDNPYKQEQEILHSAAAQLSSTAATSNFDFNSKLVTIARRSYYMYQSFDAVRPADLHNTAGNIIFINSFDHIQAVSMGDLRTYNFNDLFRPRLDSPGINYAVAMEDIQSLIIDHQPIAIVFILSPLMLNDVPFFFKYVSNQLKYFYGLLEFMKSFQATKVFLLTAGDLDNSIIHSAWSRAFSLALISSVSGQNNNRGIITLNHIEAVEADDRKCTSIPHFFKNLLRNSNASFEIDLNYCSSNYPTFTEGKSVIFSTYFTTGKYSQYGHPFKPNKFNFMKKWFLTGKQFGLTMGIFHDELNEDFITRIQSFYPNSEFVQVTKFGPNRTPNDGRFYIWYDYLMANPGIERILFTDLRDVYFYTNPFEVMEAVGNYLFVGIDNSFHLSTFSNNGIKSNTLKCHAYDEKEVSFFLQKGPFYNAGVLGGQRKTVLNFLKHMTDLLDKTPKNRNCNMGTYAFVSSKYFFDSSFTGYPFQSSFKIGVKGPTNVAVKHKTYPGNNVIEETLD